MSKWISPPNYPYMVKFDEENEEFLVQRKDGKAMSLQEKIDVVEFWKNAFKTLGDWTAVVWDSNGQPRFEDRREMLRRKLLGKREGDQ